MHHTAGQNSVFGKTIDFPDDFAKTELAIMVKYFFEDPGFIQHIKFIR